MNFDFCIISGIEAQVEAVYVIVGTSQKVGVLIGKGMPGLNEVGCDGKKTRKRDASVKPAQEWWISRSITSELYWIHEAETHTSVCPPKECLLRCRRSSFAPSMSEGNDDLSRYNVYSLTGDLICWRE